ncbi:Nn.00g057760.m01.CDS01 [Neocucurbitaria sp. VM-36]
MASTISSSSSGYLHILEQAKQDFWSSNAHLSEEQRQERWLQAASTLPRNAFSSTQPSMADQTPRSMPYSTSDMTQISNLGFDSMDRTRSAPAMVRSISTTTLDSNGSQRPTTAFQDWQSMVQEPLNEYTLYSATPMRKRSSLQPIVEGTTFVNDSTVEYSPDDYINTCIEPAGSSLPLSLPQQPQQLHVQLTPSLEWSSSSDSSTSPSTPSTALMTPVTQSSNAMSRQSSYNPHFLDTAPMLRVQSDSSCMLPILSEDGILSFPFDVESKTISSHVDSSHFLNFTGSTNEAFFPPVSDSVSASAQALASSPIEQSYLAEDMRRSASTSSSESNVSDVSAPSSTCSRQSRREREINAQAATRKIAPKAVESSDETESTSSNAKMARIRSEDGSSKTVGVISKTPYVRPQHPKIMCQYCSERPEGFRGTHELDRHIARAHATRRKGFICIDFSPDKKFLANCKHCRNKKVYGAYYNAAAHLRRAHFHPRKRGRKGKNDEKRGGIGGGDHPAMEYLKQHWIKEVEVDNKPLPQSPESASDDAPEPVETSYDATYEVDASYPSSQQQVPSSMNTQVSVDPSQYVDYGMSMHASEPMMLYDNTAFAYDPSIVATNDINNFQFDVYMAQ